MRKDIIEYVVENDLCTGCGLCQSAFKENKISIVINKAGFFRPTINRYLLKEENEIFSKFCPGLIVKKDKEISLSKKTDVLWGHIFSCLIGRSTDHKIIKEASSGGAISSLLSFLLETNKVEAIIHIGISKVNPYLNEIKISTNREQIIECAGSRYSPSAPLTNILNNIKHYKSYAFVGKPCDIAALRQYSQYNDQIKEKIKYYISFFCAGIPSLNATKDIINAMDISLDTIKRVDYRKDGWPGYFKVTDSEDQMHKLSYSLTWMKLLGPRIQFRCKVCADGIGHLADIVCADAWEDYDEKGFPTFKDALGQSLIISRTEAGESILEELIDKQYIQIIKKVTDYRQIDNMQPGQYTKKVYFLSRNLAILLKKRKWLKFSSSFFLKASLKASPIAFLKNFYGTLKRI